MPAFSFEKISSTARRAAAAPVAEKKPRGVIVQILERFAEMRVKRGLPGERAAAGEKDQAK